MKDMVLLVVVCSSASESTPASVSSSPRIDPQRYAQNYERIFGSKKQNELSN